MSLSDKQGKIYPNPSMEIKFYEHKDVKKAVQELKDESQLLLSDDDWLRERVVEAINEIFGPKLSGDNPK